MTLNVRGHRTNAGKGAEARKEARGREEAGQEQNRLRVIVLAMLAKTGGFTMEFASIAGTNQPVQIGGCQSRHRLARLSGGFCIRLSSSPGRPTWPPCPV